MVLLLRRTMVAERKIGLFSLVVLLLDNAHSAYSFEAMRAYHLGKLSMRIAWSAFCSGNPPKFCWRYQLLPSRRNVLLSYWTCRGLSVKVSRLIRNINKALLLLLHRLETFSYLYLKLSCITASSFARIEKLPVRILISHFACKDLNGK